MCQAKEPGKNVGAGEHQYLYNGKELNTDFDINLYEYGARWYDPAIGRFTGVDPIADEFPWVNTYNYAENEPVGSIDLHGLQRFKSIDGPRDLLSTKMLHNGYEGVKKTASEAGSKIAEGASYLWGKFNEWGGDIEDAMPEQGIPSADDFHDSNDKTDGGLEVMTGDNNDDLNSTNSSETPAAKEGGKIIEGTFPTPGGASARGRAASRQASGATQYSRSTSNSADAINKGREAVEEYRKANSDKVDTTEVFKVGPHNIIKTKPKKEEQ